MRPKKAIVVVADRDAAQNLRCMQLRTWGYLPADLQMEGDAPFALLLDVQQVHLAREALGQAQERWPGLPSLAVDAFTPAERESLLCVGVSLLVPQQGGRYLRDALRLVARRKPGPKPGHKMPPRGVRALAMAMEAAV